MYAYYEWNADLGEKSYRTVQLDWVVMILEVTLRSSGTRSPPITPRVYFDSP